MTSRSPVRVAALSQLFSSLAFTLAGSAEGARTARLHAATRSWGVSCRAAVDRSGLVAVFDVNVDLPLPHPARSAPPRTEMTRAVGSFRIDDPVTRSARPPRTRPGAATHLIGSLAGRRFAARRRRASSP